MTPRFFLILAAGAVAACNQQEASPEEVGATAAQTADLSDEAVDGAELPVKEDFEEEAFSTITEDNLESQVDALEREIAADVE